MPEAEWCWNHHPDYEHARRRRAWKGGKRGARGRPSVELARLQRVFEGLASRVLEGDVERGVAAVAAQCLNGARACIRDGLAARQQEELVERLENLEREALETKTGNGGRRWGA
jgi:hypothetical protein